MNRKDRRKTGGVKDPVYHLKASDIEKIRTEAYQKAYNDALDKSFKMLLSIPSLVLHDKWGFGEKRLNKFIESCLEWYSDCCDPDKEAVGIEDIIKTVEEETGVKIV